MYTNPNRIWDPLYGLYELSPIEWLFASSPEVQRLRHVRLCNIDSLLIPGAAQVSRFEHALGALRLANEWIQTHETHADEANDLRIAALVHDMQSGPFGHSFQYILEDNTIGRFAHEDVLAAGKEQYHQELRANASYAGVPFQVQSLCGKRWHNVSQLINGKGRLGRLISGSIDLDNIDNVVRLAFHVGLCEQSDRILPIELARGITPTHSGLSISAEALPLLYRWQDLRKRLYTILLLDWGEFSGKAMLTRAFEDAVRLEMVGTDSWRMTDDELIQRFLDQVGEGQSIKEMTRRLRLGQLFTPILLLRSSASNLYTSLNRIEKKREIETNIRHAAYKGQPSVQILIHFILDVKKTERAINVIINETQKSEIVGRDSNLLLIGIFASKTPAQKDAASLHAAALRILTECGCKDMEMIADPFENSKKRNDQPDLFDECQNS